MKVLGGFKARQNVSHPRFTGRLLAMRRTPMRLSRMLPMLVALTLAGCQSTKQPLRLDSMLSSSRPKEPKSQAIASAQLPEHGKRLLPDFFGPQTDKHQKTPNVPLHPLLSEQKPSTMQHLRNSASSLANSLSVNRPDANSFPSNDPTSLHSSTGAIRPELHLSAARLLERQGNLMGAKQHYAQLLKTRPDNRNGLIGMARIQHRLGEMDEAIQSYQHALARFGDDPVILNDFALCLARDGRDQEAAAALTHALSMKPESLMYRNNLAAILVQANQPQKAVAALSEAQGPAVAHYNVAYLLNKRGRVGQAHSHFLESLRHDPNFTPSQTMLNQVAPQIGRRQVPSETDRASNALASPTVAAVPAVTHDPIAFNATPISGDVAAAIVDAIRLTPPPTAGPSEAANPVMTVSALMELPGQPAPIESRELPPIRYPQPSSNQATPGLIAPLPSGR